MAQLAFYYFSWHYSDGVRDYLRIWSNFIWFVWHFFSFELLGKTLFMPFQRIEEAKAPGFHPDKMAEAVMVNLLMRILGFVIRLFILGVGAVILMITCVSGALFFVVWLSAPLCVLLLMVTGLLLLVE